jgi:DNA-binding response OmpR family regulator
MRIGVADDDPIARSFAIEVLQGAGHSCIGMANGRDVVSQLKRETFDLLLLDWNMPGMSAIEVIAWARRNLAEIPKMIVLTSRESDSDIVHALDMGADDFISKPAAPNVLRARVAAVLRRAPDAQADQRYITHGRYCFDLLEMSVRHDDDEVRMTAKEFELALLFFENLQRPLSRGYILERIWNSTIDLSTRTLDMHVSKVRSKLKLKPENGYRLQTVFGYGYRLDGFGNTQNDGVAQAH